MQKLGYVIMVAAIISCATPSKKDTSYVYPETRKDSIVDDYFGTKIPDPYRWLEDDNSEETMAWVSEQNKVTFNYLDNIPFRDSLKKRMTDLWNYEKQSLPYRKGAYYFYMRNDGIQNQSVHYMKKGLNGEEELLLDPNKLSEDGTVALSGLSITKDAKYAAYSVSKAGSDWREVYVMDIASKTNLKDHLQWVKFSGMSWNGDGFYYSRYDAPEEGGELSQKNEYHKVYFHQLGTTQNEDIIVYEDKNHPLRNFGAGVTEDGSFLIVSGFESTSGNTLIVKDLITEKNEWIPVVNNFENDHEVIDNIGKKLLIKTNLNAPNNKIVLVDPQNPSPENWVDVIPEKKHVMQSVSLCNGKLVVKYLENVTNKLYVYSNEGNLEQEITLPGLGIAGFYGNKEDSIAFVSFVNYTQPKTNYKYNISTNSLTEYFKPSIDFKSENYETTQAFYKSKDGTDIPIFITHKKGIKKDGNNPTFLYGYGGFNISITPNFRIDRLVFLENGGIYVTANLRGGSEYGEAWHESGTKLNKQNVFDDFIAAAEYLIAEKYTCKEKLAIHGRSNGGLLVGAVMTQRPDLCQVALPKVGVLDMLRYHKFTIGYAWATDYGSSEEEEHFRNLLKYSPLHNVKQASYPATLVMTGDHDDRVVPAHSFKYAATLQEKHNGEQPVMIRIDVNAGHGAGKPVSKQIDEFGDTWAFVFHNLGMELN